jgi:adenosylcobinamide kinase / adenosylcobinamide-phosphate guanylyltransferase
MESLSPSELVLFLGGQRSGKSEVAERLAATGPRPITYVATICDGSDPELEERIARHRLRRDGSWRTVVADGDLRLPSTGTVLVDGLGMWLAGLPRPVDPEWVVARVRRNAATVVVTEEVGMGLVPSNEEARRFADSLGALNRAMAEVADRVYLVVAGRVLTL